MTVNNTVVHITDMKLLVGQVGAPRVVVLFGPLAWTVVSVAWVIDSRPGAIILMLVLYISCAEQTVI